MGQDRQTGLTLLNIYPEIDVGTDNVISRFANSGKHNLDLLYETYVVTRVINLIKLVSFVFEIV